MASIKNLLHLLNTLVMVIVVAAIFEFERSLHYIKTRHEFDEGTVLGIYMISLLAVTIVSYSCGLIGLCTKNLYLTAGYAAILCLCAVFLPVFSFIILDEKLVKDWVTIYLEVKMRLEMDNSGSMSNIQEQYECCGINGATDYTAMQKKIPQSCYYNLNFVRNFLPSVPYEQGCLSPLVNKYKIWYYLYKQFVWIPIIIILVMFICALIMVKQFYRRRFAIRHNALTPDFVRNEQNASRKLIAREICHIEHPSAPMQSSTSLHRNFNSTSNLVTELNTNKYRKDGRENGVATLPRLSSHGTEYADVPYLGFCTLPRSEKPNLTNMGVDTMDSALAITRPLQREMNISKYFANGKPAHALVHAGSSPQLHAAQKLGRSQQVNALMGSNISKILMSKEELSQAYQNALSRSRETLNSE